MKHTDDDTTWTALAVSVTLCAMLCAIGFGVLFCIT